MKTASSTDACRRCTALVPSDASRCSLCGWPAGVSYPPREQHAMAPDEAAAEIESDDSELDALPGIVQHCEPAVVLDEPDPLTAPLDALLSSIQSHGEQEGELAGIDDPSPAARRTFEVQRLAQVLIGGAALSNLMVAAMETIAAGTTAVLMLALISLAIWTAAVITFLHWVSRTYSHVVSTSSVQQRHGATMAVAGWMIPVVGVVIGYRVLQDLWTGSDPQTRANPSAAPAKVRLLDMWLLGLVTGVLFGYVLPAALGGSALWGILSAVGVVTAALALIRVIGTLDGWANATAVTTSVDEPAPSIDEGTVTVRVDDLEAGPSAADQPLLTPHGG